MSAASLNSFSLTRGKCIFSLNTWSQLSTDRVLNAHFYRVYWFAQDFSKMAIFMELGLQSPSSKKGLISLISMCWRRFLNTFIYLISISMFVLACVICVEDRKDWIVLMKDHFDLHNLWDYWFWSRLNPRVYMYDKSQADTFCKRFEKIVKKFVRKSSGAFCNRLWLI